MKSCTGHFILYCSEAIWGNIEMFFIYRALLLIPIFIPQQRKIEM